jgi:DNA-binding transcriptional LysR family regulator
MHNLESGEIRIGVSDTVCKYHVIPCIESFSRIYPKIKIRVVNRTSGQIINILKNGLVDFGIVTLPVLDNNISTKEFIAVEDVFIASDKFSELKDKTVSLESLSRYPLLMLDRNSTTRRNLDIFLSSKGVGIAPEIELESIDLLVEFAKIGMGIACVLRESALDAIKKKEVFEIKTDETLPIRMLGIVSMKDVPLSRASREFIELLTRFGNIIV